MKKLIYALSLSLIAVALTLNVNALTTILPGDYHVVNGGSFDQTGYVVQDSGHLVFGSGYYQFDDTASIEIESLGFLTIYGNVTLTSQSAVSFWQGILVHGFNGICTAPNLPTALTTTMAILIDGSKGPIVIGNAETGIKFLDDIYPGSGTSSCRSMLGDHISFLQCKLNSLHFENSNMTSNSTVLNNCYFFSNQSMSPLIDHVYLRRLYDWRIEGSHFDCKPIQKGIYLKQADMICSDNFFLNYDFAIYHSHSSSVSNSTIALNRFESSTVGSRAMRSEHSSNLQFTENRVIATGVGSYGLNLWQSTSVYAKGNNISVYFYGLNSQGGVDNKYLNNIVRSKNTGIRSRLSDAPFISENEITIDSLGSIGIDIQQSFESIILDNQIEGEYLNSLAGIRLKNTGIDLTIVKGNTLSMAQSLLLCDGHNLGLYTCKNVFTDRAQYGVNIINGVGIDDQGMLSSGSDNDMNLLALGWVAPPYAYVNNQGTFNTYVKFYSFSSGMLTPMVGAVEIAATLPGCSVAKTTTGVENSSTSGSRIHTFPNPVLNEFTVDVGSEGINEITIFDLKGAIVMHKTVTNVSVYSLNLEEIQSGTYMALIKTDHQSVRKIMVKL